MKESPFVTNYASKKTCIENPTHDNVRHLRFLPGLAL
jgi:hypothetical protein